MSINDTVDVPVPAVTYENAGKPLAMAVSLEQAAAESHPGEYGWLIRGEWRPCSYCRDIARVSMLIAERS